MTAPPTYPVRCRVEAAWGASLDDDPVGWTWTDLSDRLTSSVTITRGKRTSGQTPPARAELELDNADGALTPRHPLSPYYPSVRKGTPLRVSVWHDGAWHIRFTGQIAAFAPRWPEGNYPGGTNLARVSITAAGALRRLRQGERPLRSSIRRLASSPVNTLTIGQRVVAYWPLEEGSETTAGAQAAALPGSGLFVPGGAWRWAGDDSLPSSGALPSVSGGQPYGFNAVAPIGTFTDWAVEFFLRIPTPAVAPATTPIMLISLAGGGPFTGWMISINDTSLVITSFVDGILFGTSTYASNPAMFGGWSLVRFDHTQNGGNVDWTWAWAPLGSGGAFGSGSSYPGTTGRVAALHALATAPPDGISYGHVMVTNGLPLGWLAPADTAWVGETAASRIRRLCIEEGLDVTVVGALADSEPLGPQRVTTLMGLIEESAEADGGVLSELRDTPGIRYATRRSLVNQAPAITLDASMVGAGLRNPFEPSEDDDGYANDVTVSRPDGSSYRWVGSSSVDDDPLVVGRYESDVALNVAEDSQLRRQSAWRWLLATWPEMRYRTLSLDLTAGPEGLTDAWLATDLGDRIVITDPPPEHPPGDVDQLIDGYTETIGPDRWTVDLVASPAGPYNAGVLDTDGAPDTSMRRLATDGSELASGIDDDDTSLSVAVTDGPLWTTDGAHFPLDVLIGGERITVTAIAGASSPQTFTVGARAVNGVAKAHLAGAVVQVADPLLLVL